MRELVHRLVEPHARERPTAVAARYRDGGIGYREVKDRLYETLDRAFREPRARHDELMRDEARLDAVLADGAERARARARPTLESVREAVGLSALSTRSDSLHSESR